MSSSTNWFMILITLLTAILLTLLPMPTWAIWLRPAWVLLILIYWAMEAPYRVNIGLAWFMGIVLDVLNGTLLGEHALALTIVCYIVVRIHSRLRMFPLLQQSFSVLFLTLLYQAIIYCAQGFQGKLPNDWLYWMASVTSMVLWPWLYSIMKNWRRRFKVT